MAARQQYSATRNDLKEKLNMHRAMLRSAALLGLAILVGCNRATPPPAARPAQAQTTATGSILTSASNSTRPAAAPNQSDTAKSETTNTDATNTDATNTDAANTDNTGNTVLLGSPELTAGIPGEGPLEISEIRAWLDDPRNHQVLDIELPLGLSAGLGQVKGLDGNPLTRAKIELGRQLFFDARLAATDSNLSCSSCHDPDHGYAAATQFGVGIRDQLGNRNAPVAYNRILSDKQFWDGRAASLEDQAIGPIANPIEMGNTHDACVECLQGIEGYRLQFEKIFGELTIVAVAQAIASFERALVTGPAPFDYHEQFRAFAAVDPEELKEDDEELYSLYEEAKAAAEAHPMSESAKRGRDLFFSDKAGCTACHVGPNLSDELYHNLGVGMDEGSPDLGRYEITNDDKDRGAFKTPTVRNVAQTAPYMHDGSQKTLEEVVEWYAKGGHPNPHLSSKIKKLDLSEQDKKDLVEFMKACTGDLPRVERGRLPK
jgi:cytochrome c peroxidase